MQRHRDASGCRDTPLKYLFRSLYQMVLVTMRDCVEELYRIATTRYCTLLTDM